MLIQASSLKLSVIKEKACLLLAEGATQAETARIISKSPQTVMRWVKDPVFRARVNQLRTDLTKQAVELLQESIVENTNIVLDIAKNGGTPGVVSSRLKAALWAVERVMKPFAVEEKTAKEARSIAAHLERLSETEQEDLLSRGE